jgi:hypothetical protein
MIPLTSSTLIVCPFWDGYSSTCANFGGEEYFVNPLPAGKKSFAIGEDELYQKRIVNATFLCVLQYAVEVNL